MPLLITTSKAKSEIGAVEGNQNASTTTQLVQQKAKWAAIEDGDHYASITTHIDKNGKQFVCVEVLRPSQPNGVMSSADGKQCGNHNATKSKTKWMTVAILKFLRRLFSPFL